MFVKPLKLEAGTIWILFYNFET